MYFALAKLTFFRVRAGNYMAEQVMAALPDIPSVTEEVADEGGKVPRGHRGERWQPVTAQTSRLVAHPELSDRDRFLGLYLNESRRRFVR